MLRMVIRMKYLTKVMIPVVGDSCEIQTKEPQYRNIWSNML